MDFFQRYVNQKTDVVSDTNNSLSTSVRCSLYILPGAMIADVPYMLRLSVEMDDWHYVLPAELLDRILIYPGHRIVFIINGCIT